MKRRNLFCGIFLLVAMILGIGCAGMDQQGTIGAQEAGQYNLTLKEDVPLKESGPNQTIPASKMLSAGTRVRIIGGGDLFSYIETVYGDRGFVPRNVLEIPKQEDQQQKSSYPY